jgi:hypothetical protein
VRIIRLLIVAAVAAGSIALVTGVPAAHNGRATSAKARSFTATFSYADNSTGNAVRTGKGRFSGKFTGHTAALVRALAAAAGVPYSSISKGGRYAVRFHTDAKGDNVGLFAARFKARRLGMACATYRETHGEFVSGFVPTSGTFRTAGGTGMLARVHVSGSFRVTNISGLTTEVFSAKGSFKASLGRSKRPSAACKALAKSI